MLLLDHHIEQFLVADGVLSGDEYLAEADFFIRVQTIFLKVSYERLPVLSIEGIVPVEQTVLCVVRRVALLDDSFEIGVETSTYL